MSKRREHPADRDKLDREVYEALLAEGWLLPQTAEQVADAEKQLWQRAPAPDEAMAPDFEDVAAGAGDAPSALRSADCDPRTIEEALARAAREGGRLTSDIEAAMHRDRDAAESDGNTH